MTQGATSKGSLQKRTQLWAFGMSQHFWKLENGSLGPEGNQDGTAPVSEEMTATEPRSPVHRLDPTPSSDSRALHLPSFPAFLSTIHLAVARAQALDGVPFLRQLSYIGPYRA